MKILRKSKTRHIYLVQKVLLQGELSYYIKKQLYSLFYIVILFIKISILKSIVIRLYIW